MVKSKSDWALHDSISFKPVAILSPFGFSILYFVGFSWPTSQKLTSNHPTIQLPPIFDTGFHVFLLRGPAQRLSCFSSQIASGRWAAELKAPLGDSEIPDLRGSKKLWGFAAWLLGCSVAWLGSGGAELSVRVSFFFVWVLLW